MFWEGEIGKDEILEVEAFACNVCLVLSDTKLNAYGHAGGMRRRVSESSDGGLNRPVCVCI